MIYIIAGSPEDVRHWCVEHGRVPTEVVHVKDQRRVQGTVIRPEDVIVDLGGGEPGLRAYLETRKRAL